MRSIFSSYIFIALLTILVILVGFAFADNVGVVNRKAKEEKLHQANLARIEQSNVEAQTNIDLLKDNKILEQEFRKRFNQKREGENVVIIYPSEEENRREPLTDQEFLQLYNERQKSLQPAEQEQKQSSSFLDTIRSVLGNVIGGTEYSIGDQEDEVEDNDGQAVE